MICYNYPFATFPPLLTSPFAISFRSIPSTTACSSRPSPSPPTSTPLTKTSLRNSKQATKTHNRLAMQKWLMLLPISSQLPSSRTIQKKFMVRTSLKAVTSMNRLLGATPRRRVRMPRLALMRAKGMRSFRTRRAPWEKGLKTGISR